MQQLQRDYEVASAVMSNRYTRIVFRVGDDDAKKLAEGFSFFEAHDLQNLDTGQAICRVERSDHDFNLSVPLPEVKDPAEAAELRHRITTLSREKYGTPRTEVEAVLLAKARASAPKQELTASQPVQSVVAKPPLASRPSEPPVSAQGPKLTISEKRILTPSPSSEKQTKVDKPVNDPAPKRQERHDPAPARELGRGGAQHQAIQQRIKQAAEALGFRSVIEKPILDGRGSIDLLLERDGQAIACEISISTTIDHEVGNVAKCAKAGFSAIAIICIEDERLQKIAEAVSGSLGEETASRVLYRWPDQFIAHLKALPITVPEHLETARTRRGYKVTHSLTKLTVEEQKQKEEAAIRAMADSMRAK